MEIFYVAAVIIVFVFTAVFLLDRARLSRRRELVTKRYSQVEREELAEDFRLYGLLPAELKDQLDGLCHVFVEEKGFEACGGLEEVTLRMQRVIAAQACLLILNRPHNMYKKLRTILLYPGAFGYDEGGVRLGESWSSGTVILSWNAVVAGGKNAEDGHDVSLHEFSHQLDQENSHSEGVPYLESAGAYREWSKAFAAGFERFSLRVDAGKKTVFDKYGATNPAEFFAVATETFFEKPKQMEKKYPDVYAAMKDYYRLDPLNW